MNWWNALLALFPIVSLMMTGAAASGAERELNMQTATFGAGCFWGVAAEFRQLKGVKSTAVGYMGGTLDNPTYKDVCSDTTGHAEVVEVTYDPAEISYEKLLEVFWGNHDPTTRYRQGPDIGSQYRSVIFFHSPEQEAAARKSKAEMDASGRFGRPIVTEIVPAATFWRAEEYHQQYLEKRGKSSCHF
jgi:peptide-methionine (S)-S-oxide reductase